MSGIGLGLILNVLFWTVAVLVVIGLASLAVIEWFPGREPETRETPRASRGGADPADRRSDPSPDADEEEPERYRKAS